MQWFYKHIMAVQQIFVTLILCLLKLFNTATNTISDKTDTRKNFRGFHGFFTNCKLFPTKFDGKCHFECQCIHKKAKL